jgi:calcium-dependent protein kinase
LINVSGDPRYASPEMINNLYYGLRHDVWGLGVLAYFLFAGEFPFDGETTADICDMIISEEPNWDALKLRRVDSKIILLIKGMLIKDPSKRMTIRQVMSHELFQFLEKEDLKVKYSQILIPDPRITP